MYSCRFYVNILFLGNKKNDEIVPRYNQEMTSRLNEVLNKEVNKKNPDQPSILACMDATFDSRRKWVSSISPSNQVNRVIEVLKKYPCFSEEAMVSG